MSRADDRATARHDSDQAKVWLAIHKRPADRAKYLANLDDRELADELLASEPENVREQASRITRMKPAKPSAERIRAANEKAGLTAGAAEAEGIQFITPEDIADIPAPDRGERYEDFLEYPEADTGTAPTARLMAEDRAWEHRNMTVPVKGKERIALLSDKYGIFHGPDEGRYVHWSLEDEMALRYLQPDTKKLTTATKYFPHALSQLQGRTLDARDLNADPAFKAARGSGVFSLREKSGLILPKDARSKLVTADAMFPDKLREDFWRGKHGPHGMNEHLWALVGHLGDEDPDALEVLGQVLGQAQWGKPHRGQIYFVGEKKSAKSTVGLTIVESMGGYAAVLEQAALDKRTPTNYRDFLCSKALFPPVCLALLDDPTDLIAHVGLMKRLTSEGGKGTRNTKFGLMEHDVPFRATLLIIDNDDDSNRFGTEDDAQADRQYIFRFPALKNPQRKVGAGFANDPETRQSVASWIVWNARELGETGVAERSESMEQELQKRIEKETHFLVRFWRRHFHTAVDEDQPDNPVSRDTECVPIAELKMCAAVLGDEEEQAFAAGLRSVENFAKKHWSEYAKCPPSTDQFTGFVKKSVKPGLRWKRDSWEEFKREAERQHVKVPVRKQPWELRSVG